MKKFGIALAFVALAAAIGIGAGFYFTHNNGQRWHRRCYYR